MISRQILQNESSFRKKNNGIQVASNNVPCESKKVIQGEKKYKAQFLVIMVNSLQHMLTPPKGSSINYVVSKLTPPPFVFFVIKSGLFSKSSLELPPSHLQRRHSLWTPPYPYVTLCTINAVHGQRV